MLDNDIPKLGLADNYPICFSKDDDEYQECFSHQLEPVSGLGFSGSYVIFEPVFQSYSVLTDVKQP